MVGHQIIADLFFLVAIVCVAGQTQRKVYKFCTSEDQARPRECSALAVSESRVNCVTVVDSTDCVMMLKKGEADFGIFSAEEAILASHFLTSDVVQVTHEVRHEDYKQEPFAFQTVAVVRANHTGGLAGLKGKNYCHPGFKDSQMWTDTVLKYFEKKVVTNVCNASRPDIQDEMHSLNNFFNYACRPGRWVHNNYADDRLKKEYIRMCALCDAPGLACSYNPLRASGDQQSTLNCLTQGNVFAHGDVAYVALQVVKEYFGLLAGFKAKYDPSEYRLLCQNGTTLSLDNPTPCTWISQPWKSVFAIKSVSETLQTELTSYVEKPSKGSWQDTLATIMLQRDFRLVNTLTLKSVKDYVEQGREIPEANVNTCRPRPRLCVRNEERDKCAWMTTAARTIGVTPAIECVFAPDQWSCFRMINESKADFVAIESNVGYITRHTYDLTTALFQDTKAEGDHHVVGVVKKDSGVYNLESLRGKKACFPEYGGIAWVSVVEALRKDNVLVDACPYGDTLGRFFSSTCAPGANDPTHDPKGDNRKANLCSLCRSSCNATVNNQNFGDVGAIRCLSNEAADVAFINAKRIKTVIDDLREAGNKKDKEIGEDLSLKYEILCRDGTKQSLLDELKDNCPFIRAIGGEIVGKRLRSKALEADFSLAFLEMDDWFGLYSHNSESVFHMYEPFGGNDNLIFTNTTVGIRSKYDVEKEEIENYVEMKKRADECGAAGASAIFVGHLAWVFAILAAIVSTQQ